MFSGDRFGSRTWPRRVQPYYERPVTSGSVRSREPSRTRVRICVRKANRAGQGLRLRADEGNPGRVLEAQVQSRRVRDVSTAWEVHAVERQPATPALPIHVDRGDADCQVVGRVIPGGSFD